MLEKLFYIYHDEIDEKINAWWLVVENNDEIDGLKCGFVLVFLGSYYTYFFRELLHILF